MEVVAVAYVTLLLVWATLGLSGNLLAVMLLEHRYRFPHLDFGFLAAIPAVAVGMMLFFFVGLTVNLPLLSILRLARRCVPVPAARCICAAGLAIWAEWALFQMEWFDVWRHGLPGPSYWLTTLLPWGLAFASAGVVIGGAIVRSGDGNPAMSQSHQ